MSDTPKGGSAPLPRALASLAKLGRPSFGLRAWIPSDFESYTRDAKQLGRYAEEAGQDDSFKRVLAALRQMIRSGDHSALIKQLRTAKATRGFCYLYNAEPDTIEAAALTPKLEQALLGSRGHLSLLSLTYLTSAFFQHFRRAREAACLDRLSALLQREWSRQGDRGLSGALGHYAARHRQLFDAEGPTHLVREALESEVQLNDVLRRHGVDPYLNGEYAQVCRQFYFIRRLESITVGADDPVLDEVSRASVYQGSAGDGRMLGHFVLEILIARSPEEQISERWQEVVLTIAGDPRVSRTLPRYQKWWGMLTPEYAQKMIQWLSRFDLRLFLDIIKDYGHKASDAGLLRMFASRKRFLEGLIDQRLISSSRLFLTKDATYFVRRQLRGKEVIKFAQVDSSTTTAMIYLRIGTCHFVEGSNNFSLRILTDLPENDPVRSYGRHYYEHRDLGMGLEERHRTYYGGQITSIPHTHNSLIWQHKAITFLAEHGVRLDVEKLFSPTDYKAYKRRYGLPIFSGKATKGPRSSRMTTRPAGVADLLGKRGASPRKGKNTSWSEATPRKKAQVYNGPAQSNASSSNEGGRAGSIGRSEKERGEKERVSAPDDQQLLTRLKQLTSTPFVGWSRDDAYAEVARQLKQKLDLKLRTRLSALTDHAIREGQLTLTGVSKDMKWRWLKELPRSQESTRRKQPEKKKRPRRSRSSVEAADSKVSGAAILRAVREKTSDGMPWSYSQAISQTCAHLGLARTSNLERVVMRVVSDAIRRNHLTIDANGVWVWRQPSRTSTVSTSSPPAATGDRRDALSNKLYDILLLYPRIKRNELFKRMALGLQEPNTKALRSEINKLLNREKNMGKLDVSSDWEWVNVIRS
ncbi:MAG: hypothetical protein RhofKO_39490 [Rhodothermales bacterium]